MVHKYSLKVKLLMKPILEKLQQEAVKILKADNINIPMAGRVFFRPTPDPTVCGLDPAGFLEVEFCFDPPEKEPQAAKGLDEIKAR